MDALSVQARPRSVCDTRVQTTLPTLWKPGDCLISKPCNVYTRWITVSDGLQFSSRVLLDISPCGLIQEVLGRLDNSEWRIFVACSLMNMTAGLTMRPIMWRLFAKWPTPRALAAADVDEVRRLVWPLGFYNQRAPRLIDMSAQVAAGEWSLPSDLPGCGRYATNSWRIFCLGEVPSLRELKDKELRRYVHWLTTGEYAPLGESV